MNKIKDIFKKTKDHAWNTLKDTFYPPRLRKHTYRHRGDTKLHNNLNPGLANEY